MGFRPKILRKCGIIIKSVVIGCIGAERYKAPNPVLCHESNRPSQQQKDSSSAEVWMALSLDAIRGQKVPVHGVGMMPVQSGTG